MSTPTIEILSSVLQAPASNALVLDDATNGKLNTNKLGGLVDVPLDVPIRSMTISRGRSRQLDRFNAGTASISFNNFDRRLDPLNTASDLYGQIIPRQKIQIQAAGVTIFTGVINDWDISYDKTNLDFAAASASDAFSVLSNFVFDSDITPSSESPPSRVTWVLDQFNYQGDSNFGSSAATVGAYLINTGTQALEYIFNVAASNKAFFFTDVNGVLRLVSIYDKIPTTAFTFTDDGSGVSYQTLTNQYGDELLYNRIIATSPAGSVSVEDANSIVSYEVSTLNLRNLLNDSTDSLTSIANEYLNLYASPEVRFTGLSVELNGLSDATIFNILSLDLTDQISVIKTFNTGSPLSIKQDLMITGIRHVIEPDSHVVEFSCEPSQFKEAFKLDNVVYGVLDGIYGLA